MKLKELLRGIELGVSRLPESDITCVATNSKAIKRGSLFVAIKGFARDGHSFVKEAFRKGARASLVERQIPASGKRQDIIRVRDTRKALSVAAKNFYHSPSENLKVIGITGTNGKTTVSFLIESIFKSARMPCGVLGTIDYRFGKEIIPAERTTPDALTINALLDKMLKRKMKAAVMEVSSHALDQKRVDDIFFDAAIFTNLTHEHLDYHGDLERYFTSKIKIFSRLKRKGAAIINADDARAARLKKSLKCKKLTYGVNAPADITGHVKKIGLNGTSFVVKINKKKAFSVDTKLIGAHNVSNILAASAAAISQGIAPGVIKKGIEKVEAIRGRLEPVDAGQGFKVFVDYAHTHNALERVLGFLNQIKERKIITVFGAGGDRDKTKRPLMGRVAQKFSDFIIITNDNSRTEDPRKIARDIESGMNKQKRNYTVVIDRRKAIEEALEKANSGDIVLLAGKGHETEQVLKGRTIPFDDKEVAKEILANAARAISIDSRTIKRGGTFVAIKGDRFDGHDFVKEAFRKGARSAIVSRNVKIPAKYRKRLIKVNDTLKALGKIAKTHRRKFNIPVIAITGTNGKTTAKDMAHAVLSSGYKVLKNETSQNNLIGLSLTLLKLKKEHRVAILEMGMNHLGEIDRLAEIAEPDIGVVTNIGPSHLEFLGTLKNIFRAKRELLRHLSKRGKAILNKDDAYLSNVKGLKCGTVYFGVDKKCGFQARNLSRKGNSWFFSVGKERFELPLPGKHNIYNALIAIALARQFGMSFGSIRKKLKAFKHAPRMRLEFKNVRGLKMLDDSYNSNPLSMQCAIDTLAGYDTKGKRIIVSGDMMELGEKAKNIHEEVGKKIARAPVDVLITLGNLSRFTNKGARLKGKTELYHAKSHTDAARFLKKVAKPGDVVLVKGSRAMKMERIITCYTTYYTR